LLAAQALASLRTGSAGPSLKGRSLAFPAEAGHVRSLPIGKPVPAEARAESGPPRCRRVDPALGLQGPATAPRTRHPSSPPATCVAALEYGLALLARLHIRWPLLGFPPGAGNPSSESTASHPIPQCFAPGRCGTPPTPHATRSFRVAENARYAGLAAGRPRATAAPVSSTRSRPPPSRPGPLLLAASAAGRRLAALFRWTLHRPGRPNGQPDRGRVCPPGWTPGGSSLPLAPGRRRWGGVRPIGAPLDAPPPTPRSRLAWGPPGAKDCADRRESAFPPPQSAVLIFGPKKLVLRRFSGYNKAKGKMRFRHAQEADLCPRLPFPN
jgi:hypothetical protein